LESKTSTQTRKGKKKTNASLAHQKKAENRKMGAERFRRYG